MSISVFDYYTVPYKAVGALNQFYSVFPVCMPYEIFFFQVVEIVSLRCVKNPVYDNTAVQGDEFLQGHVAEHIEPLVTQFIDVFLNVLWKVSHYLPLQFPVFH